MMVPAILTILSFYSHLQQHLTVAITDPSPVLHMRLVVTDGASNKLTVCGGGTNVDAH